MAGHDKRHATSARGLSFNNIKSFPTLLLLAHGSLGLQEALEASPVRPTASSFSDQLGKRATPSTIPLVLTNQCGDDIYPGITTQHSTGPDQNGFKLTSGESKNLSVAYDWQGRVWGRTNCSFADENGPTKACSTGDCAGALNCKVTGLPPVTLAEFTCNGEFSQTYYDISLVDGFNIGMAIVLLSDGIDSIAALPPNRTNPSCVGSVAQLVDRFEPYSTPSQKFLGTNSSFPIRLNSEVSRDQVHRWCPWDLQVNPPKKPGDGVYPYPDDNIQRPVFNPCWSACAKYNSPEDCCTGKYNSPKVCKANKYAQQAKKVCPDAYSFAYDDRDSTFTVPAGAGFQVIFCPAGQSTTILSASSPKLVTKSEKHFRFRRDLSRLHARATEKMKSSAASIDVRHLPLIIMTFALMLTASVFVTL